MSGDGHVHISPASSSIPSFPALSGSVSPDEAQKTKTMKIDIICKENIKPDSPTPHHLRIYKLSLLDQFCHPNYSPFVFFYPNNESKDLMTLISEKSRHLKQSLSETLTSYYPFAGQCKNNLHVDCDDTGVYYVETRVNDRLTNFLSHPDYKLIPQLLPCEPSDMKSNSSGSYIIKIQVNFFECGGIAISMSASHKIIDGMTYVMFLKAWAAVARGSNSNLQVQKVYPSFIQPPLFPPVPDPYKDLSRVKFGSLSTKGKSVTRRFVFDASALVALKAKASTRTLNPNPTRVEAVTALLWKSTTAAWKAIYGPQRLSVLSFGMDLRRKHLPPLPVYSVGNIVYSAVAQCTTNIELELQSMLGHLRKATVKINSDLVEELKGDKGFLRISQRIKELGALYSNSEADILLISSTCNSGFYEADFGWGKPIWSCFGHVGVDNPVIPNLTYLMDTRSGDGIEAWVTLNEQEMAIVEQDLELLAFASMDPTPLNQSLNSMPLISN